MREITTNIIRTVCLVTFLVLAYASAVLAGDPNKDTLSKKVDSRSQRREQQQFPEISWLRLRADSEHVSPQERELAQRAIRRWDNGVVDPEPILVEASLQRGKLDEYTGRMTYGLMGKVSSRAPAALNLVVVDEDRDLLGVRIKERYVLPNGVESSFEETYPAYIDGVQKTMYTGATVIPVHLRTGNRVKDEEQWRAYVDQAEHPTDSKKMPTPRIWITAPDPNAVEVSVSIYDQQGHESEAIPVHLLPTESKLSMALGERQALKPYEEHGADVAHWPDDPVTPRPDNAALLYYRALACLPKADPCTVRIMDLMSRGREPEDRVRKYLGECLKPIQLAQLASQLPECDWGLIQDPLWEHMTEAHRSLRGLSRTLVASARTLAVDGHYRAALENCLVVRRLARHIGDDTYILYCISRETGYIAIRGILDVLAKTPSDPEILAWLRGQLVTVKGTPSRPAAAFGKWRDRELLEWRPYDGDKPFDRSWALAQLRDESQRSEPMDSLARQRFLVDEAERKEMMQLPDEQLHIRMLWRQRMRLDCEYGLDVPDELFAQARKEYDAFADSAVRIMEGNAPYERKRAGLEELTKESHDAMERRDPVALLGFPGEAAEYYHQSTVSDAAYLNCALAAIEIRLIEARTGQLPETIPEGLPLDPFTRRDLDYELTDEGFVLRFDPERLSGIRVREFKFRTRDL